MLPFRIGFVVFVHSVTMSDQSDEDLLESRLQARASTSGTTATKKIADLSDDESDEDVPATSTVRREPSPLSPTGHSDSPAAFPSTYLPRRRSPARPVDSYNRSVSSSANCIADSNVNVVHLPPSVSLSSALTTDLEQVPPESNPMLFRLLSNVAAQRGESSAETCLRELKACRFDPTKYSDFLESNSNLITWSDGSQTLSIGSSQFQLVEDAIASRHFVFQRGEKVQTHHSEVCKVARVQPTSVGDARAKLVMANAVERAANRGGESKTILRCIDDDAERKKKQAQLDQNRRERERVRIEARKRQLKERQARPSRPLTVEGLESNDEDSADDHVKRMADHYDANRLMRAKRAPPPPSRGAAELSIKRRKAGGRRVLADDDDSESE